MKFYVRENDTVICEWCYSDEWPISDPAFSIYCTLSKEQAKELELVCSACGETGDEDAK